MTIVFILSGVILFSSGIYVLFLWIENYLDVAQFDIEHANDYTLAVALIKAAVAIIIVGLFVRATRFRVGYFLSLILTICGFYCEYLLEATKFEEEHGDVVLKKYICLVLQKFLFLGTGFLLFVFTSL